MVKNQREKINCKFLCYVEWSEFVALGGAGLAAERSEEERSGAKPRGRGLGQRNIKHLQLKEVD